MSSALQPHCSASWFYSSCNSAIPAPALVQFHAGNCGQQPKVHHAFIASAPAVACCVQRLGDSAAAEFGSASELLQPVAGHLMFCGIPLMAWRFVWLNHHYSVHAPLGGAVDSTKRLVSNTMF